MYNPVSTVRIQFNKDFTFKRFEELLPFFIDLGVNTIYASPVFKAAPGSLHGYDVVNPLAINPEIGTIEDLIRISKALHENHIGWIQDIVPNHMAFHSNNAWLNDVLEKGPMSAFADFFDSTWSGDFFQSNIMAPFLGKSIEETIRNNELTLVIESGFYLRYFDNLFPINARSCEFVLAASDSPAPQGIASILQQLDDLHKISDPVQYNLRWLEIATQLKLLYHDESSGEFIRRQSRPRPAPPWSPGWSPSPRRRRRP